MKTFIITALFLSLGFTGSAQDDKKVPEKKLHSANTNVSYDPAKKPERKLVQKSDIQRPKGDKPAGIPEKKLVDKK